MKDFMQGRATRAAYTEPLSHATNAALLIDFDNVTMGIRSDLQNQLRRLLNSEIIKGKVAVQRAYADWRRYPQYIVPLSEASIDLIFAPAFGSNKKNATDIRLAIDALELVFTRPEIGTFILLSGDSDFSSLVLKLKEYGKYIIGVGIRESSSDLLVQNCDEYYGYNELTGLTKERETQSVRRDPWELVVDAVRQMKKDGDVMRSDRLKQVMQELDPNFDEKDAGFNRFSKFVIEAAQRGLLALTKMENGQYAVDLGSNANVPPGEESTGETPEREPRGRRKRPARRAGAAPGLTLAEAFELLRQALLVLGAVDEEATGADQAREKMMELLGDDSDPLFERHRFQRLLRQAHDADLIELIKQDGDVYMLRLGPQALVSEESEQAPSAAPAPPTPEDVAAATEDAKPARGRRRGTRGGSRGAAKTRGRAGGAKTTAARKPAEVVEAAPPRAAAADEEKPARKRNPRYRRGSRGAPPTASLTDEPTVADAASPTSRPTSPSAPRTLGPRRGGRSGRRGAPEPAAGSEGTPALGVRQQGDGPPPTQAPAAERAAADRLENRPAAGGGLLKRMTAALQKVVKGTDAEDAGPTGP